jgi:hypothetical protein
MNIDGLKPPSILTQNKGLTLNLGLGLRKEAE